MTFYMTYARSRPSTIVPYAEKNGIGLMTNAAHRWSSAKSAFLDLWDYDCPHIVDSGGYNVQAQHGSYPWTVQDYHDWLSGYADRIDWAACMDYACEDRFDGLHTVGERVDKTVRNTVEQFDMGPDYDLLPVLQGRSVDGYVDCYDRLKAAGVPVEHVGLGTVCRISSSKEIVHVERKVRELCEDVERIHGFGVKIDAFRMGSSFETADSQAWVYAASNGQCYVRNGDSLKKVDMPDDSKRRTVESFKNYHEHVTELKQ